MVGSDTGERIGRIGEGCQRNPRALWINGDGSVVRLDPKVSNAVDGNGVRRPNGGEFALNQASRVVLEDEAAFGVDYPKITPWVKGKTGRVGQALGKSFGGDLLVVRVIDEHLIPIVVSHVEVALRIHGQTLWRVQRVSRGGTAGDDGKQAE